MKMSRKVIRHEKIHNYLKEDPFLTDEDLAKEMKVSIQTIRLDRLELGIPEVRERTKRVAEGTYSKVKALLENEFVGEPVDIELGVRGISILNISEDMVFQKSKIARGHHLFAQANSLAVAIIDSELALTGTARVSYKRPVCLGEKIVSKALVEEKRGNKYIVSVISKIEGEEVFDGNFIIFDVKSKEGGNDFEGRS